jgi:hypothetical protein
MIGVPIKEPKTPPFDIVNVPPSISSIARVPSRALFNVKNVTTGQHCFQDLGGGGRRSKPDSCPEQNTKVRLRNSSTFSPSALIVFSMSAKFIVSTLRITGTTKP